MPIFEEWGKKRATLAHVCIGELEEMRWLWLGVAAVLSGCATQTGGFSERDRLVLEGRIDDLESMQARQKTRISGLEKQVRQLEDMVAMLSRRTSVDTREVVKIEPDQKGISSQFSYDTSLSDDVYQEIVISEDKKRTYFGNSGKARVQGGGSSGARQAYDNVVTGDRLPPSAGEGVQAAKATGGEQPVSAMVFYREGIDLYRQGNFSEARAKFEKFLAANPEESYIDNALYWIGECFYGEGYYHEAAGYFHRIVQEYPHANKVPDALLKVSLTYQRLGKIDSALEMLRYLMSAFPGTEAARIGKEKYEGMAGRSKKEGGGRQAPE